MPRRMPSRQPALDTGDVCDGGEVIVVKAVPEAEQRAGEQGELEGMGHRVCRVRGAAAGRKRGTRRGLLGWKRHRSIVKP